MTEISTTIGFLTADLMFHSRVSQAVKNGTSNAQTSTLIVNRNVESLIEKLVAVGQVRLIIVDLAMKGLDVQQTMSTFKEKLPAVPIIAYGPHVAGELLQAASESGIKAVYTRGQFDHQMNEIIREYQT